MPNSGFEGLENIIRVVPIESRVGGLGEDGEEFAAVRAVNDAAVENGDHTRIVLAANETADALAELQRRLRQGDFLEGAATGFIPGPKVPGMTSGRNSALAIFKTIRTKASNGTISSITTRTAGKMALGAFTGFAVPQGAAASASLPALRNYFYGDGSLSPPK